MQTHLRLAALPGDGIGPEVVQAAVRVLQAAVQGSGLSLEVNEGLAGGIAIDTVGEPLPKATQELCLTSDAVLFGAVGGAQWDHLPIPTTPEYAIINLRKLLDCYANLRFGRSFGPLLDQSPLKESVLGEGIDILLVREIKEDIYYGQPKFREATESGERAVDTAVYNSSTIARIINLACDMAASRRNKVTVVAKPNVLETSKLFRDVAEQVASSRGDIQLEHEIVDTTTLHLVTRPSHYDVIATTNQFGDLLGDEIGIYAGSLGLAPSATLSDKDIHLYEPVHGSAPDIAGANSANPTATILCLSLLFRYSCGREDLANKIERAIDAVLYAGLRTADIAAPNQQSVSTDQFTDAVVANVTK